MRAARRDGLLVTDRRPWASHAPTKPGAPTTASTEPIARAHGRCGPALMVTKSSPVRFVARWSIRLDTP
jgi:hypothetical protein